ncbi:UDP-glucose/GDP-mannose dehydrogenase family protein [Candidatus Micrarchaeota archaeon]|nr:UDP-glucose/GDP-mannose dehydrogenase family protein [Candidatus Micrarchaeota archaeon]
MKICVIGTGYVGLISACGFAKLGHDVSCVDLDESKVEMINNARPPIFEEGLEALLKEVSGRSLHATANLDAAISGSQLIFITVGTPSREDGSIDLSYIHSAFLGALNSPSFSESRKTIVVKSTVVPGTCDSLAKMGEEKTGKAAGVDYGLCMNPEFLREGKAVYDFFNPDRIVLGATGEESASAIRALYSSFSCPKLETSLKAAEMIKYASNSLLAAKISFSNEIGNLCKKLGIDVYEVMDGVGLDKRIERSFLNAGIGFGGSCFPKDVKALASISKEHGIDPALLDSVIKVNEAQPAKIVELATARLGSLSGKKATILGIAFKPDSDDIREAPSIKVINSLLKEGAEVCAYDPQALPNLRKLFGERISYADSLGEALGFSDTIFALTDWAEFKDEKLYKGKFLLDGRKVLNKKSGVDYEGVCW